MIELLKELAELSEIREDNDSFKSVCGEIKSAYDLCVELDNGRANRDDIEIYISTQVIEEEYYGLAVNMAKSEQQLVKSVRKIREELDSELQRLYSRITFCIDFTIFDNVVEYIYDNFKSLEPGVIFDLLKYEIVNRLKIFFSDEYRFRNSDSYYSVLENTYTDVENYHQEVNLKIIRYLSKMNMISDDRLKCMIDYIIFLEEDYRERIK